MHLSLTVLDFPNAQRRLHHKGTEGPRGMKCPEAWHEAYDHATAQLRYVPLHKCMRMHGCARADTCSFRSMIVLGIMLANMRPVGSSFVAHSLGRLTSPRRFGWFAHHADIHSSTSHLMFIRVALEPNLLTGLRAQVSQVCFMEVCTAPKIHVGVHHSTRSPGLVRSHHKSWSRC
jgi:hypothetical protein